MAAGVNKKRFFIALMAGLALLVVSGLWPAGEQSAQAQVGNNSNELRGWAWSSNIGWISFNSDNIGAGGGADYSVRLNSDETLEGYAWSDNIGYIRFDPLYEGVDGQGDNHGARIFGSTLTGWARACAVFASGCAGTLRGDGERGGWDGWIKMTDVSVTTETNGTRKLGGFAWGYLNLGWISFAWTDFGGGGGECNPAVQDCEVTIGPDGGSDVSCSVVEDEVSPWLYHFTGTGGSDYLWYVTKDGEEEGGSVGNGSSFEYSFSEVGNYDIKLQAYDESDDPIGGLVQCTNGVLTINDQNVLPVGGGACKISFRSAPTMQYKNDRNSNEDPAIKTQITISGGCSGEGLSLRANGDRVLNNQFNLVCSNSTAAVSSFSEELCDGIGIGDYWVWAMPKDDLSDDPIIKNVFDLQLWQPGDEGEVKVDAKGIRFDYIVSGGT